MLTPQQLADAIDEAECSCTMEAVAALLFATHPERAKRLHDMPFGGEPSQLQMHIRARADALLMHLEMNVTDPRVKAACIATLYFNDEKYGGKIPAQAYRLATGTGLKRGINAGALEIKNLICACPRRKARRLEILRAAIGVKKA
ncbi:hypothetical protein JQ574_28975 [Bradyrhizobium sp. AUGA SZCCT0158]|uniref:hypothetical protein n=1 Tax=Bradyrhizobium sp. AUGA SZCCT0158 TaxID=2807661 RepID=UPI001BADBC52|nr:hypothetical protein [Bradyrhizobium sp. AUGA SZCCT0158]MBR1200031.1 hypothetical protein [Bradyrhizobium sp. AUGA SZCCT0158]